MKYPSITSSVRRAHGKPTGAFQGQETSLVRLDDGARLGGTRRETQRAIEDALGLTFDQFRRSALLAQGDFAAFLRAAPGERSALLERMTANGQALQTTDATLSQDSKLLLRDIDGVPVYVERYRELAVGEALDARLTDLPETEGAPA